MASLLVFELRGTPAFPLEFHRIVESAVSKWGFRLHTAGWNKDGVEAVESGSNFYEEGPCFSPSQNGAGAKGLEHFDFGIDWEIEDSALSITIVIGRHEGYAANDPFPLFAVLMIAQIGSEIAFRLNLPEANYRRDYSSQFGPVSDLKGLISNYREAQNILPVGSFPGTGSADEQAIIEELTHHFLSETSGIALPYETLHRAHSAVVEKLVIAITEDGFEFFDDIKAAMNSWDENSQALILSRSDPHCPDEDWSSPTTIDLILIRNVSTTRMELYLVLNHISLEYSDACIHPDFPGNPQKRYNTLVEALRRTGRLEPL